MIAACRRAKDFDQMDETTEVAMLKTLLLATALLSSSAFAYDQADRDAPLGQLVVECDSPASFDQPTYIPHPEQLQAGDSGERADRHQPQRIQSRGARYDEGEHREAIAGNAVSYGFQEQPAARQHETEGHGRKTASDR